MVLSTVSLALLLKRRPSTLVEHSDSVILLVVSFTAAALDPSVTLYSLLHVYRY